MKIFFHNVKIFFCLTKKVFGVVMMSRHPRISPKSGGPGGGPGGGSRGGPRGGPGGAPRGPPGAPRAPGAKSGEFSGPPLSKPFQKKSLSVPTGRVIKYPKKCAKFGPPGGPPPGGVPGGGPGTPILGGSDTGICARYARTTAIAHARCHPKHAERKKKFVNEKKVCKEKKVYDE